MESNFNRLPSDLTEKILATVRGVMQVFQLRLVCTAWNCLIQSPSFASLHSRIASPEPWLVTVRRVSPPNQKLYLCDRSMQRWVLPPLQFLKEFECDFSTCKSARGLVCCVARSVKPRGPKSVLVFNPITRAYKLLPSPPISGEWWGAKADMAMSREETTGEFKVALCGGFGGRERSGVRVYDSRRGRWEEGKRPGQEVGSARPRMEGYRNGTKEKVCWYEVAENRWREAKLPETHPLEVRNPAVIDAEAGGGGGRRVLLAGVLARINEGNSNFVQGFSVWELNGGGTINNPPPPPPPPPPHDRHQPPSYHRLPPPPPPPLPAPPRPRFHYGHAQLPLRPERAPLQEHLRHPSPQEPLQHPQNAITSKWTEISRTPVRFLKEPRSALRRLNDSTLVSHGQFVCMSGLTRHATSPWDCFYPWMLVYDVAENSWDWSPRPLGSKTWANFHTVCVLEPNLNSYPL